jgi:hypothetical protein
MDTKQEKQWACKVYVIGFRVGFTEQYRLNHKKWQLTPKKGQKKSQGWPSRF